MESSLFESLKMGAFTLPNRILMAPLTRGRATLDGVPTPLMADYYAQRAGAGMIIAEATAISKRGYGWLQAPGIFTEAHVQGWQMITDSVHEADGQILLQLWHMGRVSHPDFLDGQLPVAPSAIAAQFDSNTPIGRKPYVVPHALTIDEIKATVKDYKAGAQRAKDADFDGVEIHGANGYLLDQFLRDSANKRTDIYGGSVQNRARLLCEVIEAVVSVWGSDRVGVRLSPRNPINSMNDSDAVTTFCIATEMLNAYNLAYLHSMEPLPGHPRAGQGERVSPYMRNIFRNTFIANGGYTKALGEKAIADNEADAIAYGVPFLANPDLVDRFKTDAPLNAPDPSTFYTHESKGYNDYPALKSAAA